MGPSILTPSLDIQDETIRVWHVVKGSNTGTWKGFSGMMNLVEDGDTVRVHVWITEMMFYMCKMQKCLDESVQILAHDQM